MPRVQIRIWWMLVAVALVTLLLTLLPNAIVALLFTFLTVLTVLISIPTFFAPSGYRIEVATWALATHPLMLLAWLFLWRSPWYRPSLGYRDHTLFTGMVLELPWIMSFFSLLYMPILLILACAARDLWFPSRNSRKPLMLIARDYLTDDDSASDDRNPYKPLMLVPLVWFLTFFILAWDSFELADWIWD